MNAEQGCYVYGITWAEGAVGLDDVQGIGGRVYLVTSGGVSAVVSDVPLEEFGEETIERNLARIEWIAATAQAHQQVLAAVSGAGAILPMRLCTIYRDRDRVREMLEEHQDKFAAALARLDGKDEWGVKLYSDPETLRAKAIELSEEVRSFSSQIEGKSPGAAYFLKKRLEEMTGSEMERIQDAAYLVTREGTQQFREELDAIRREGDGRGFTYELSGPWPPYNFAAPGRHGAEETREVV